MNANTHRASRSGSLWRRSSLCGLLLVAATAVGASDRDAAGFWHQWRGPLATGVAPHATPPVRWSESTNVRWKVKLPGKGHSSPIIWNDMFSASPALVDNELYLRGERHLYCLSDADVTEEQPKPDTSAKEDAR